jgi:hypothetical protein
LNTYLDDLDFGRVYFLAGDIADFEQYRNTLDDALKKRQPAARLRDVQRLSAPAGGADRPRPGASPAGVSLSTWTNR